MKPLWVPLAGGVCIPLFLFALVSFAGAAMEHRWGLAWLANALTLAIVAPMALWEKVFPPMSSGPSDKATAATIVTVFLFYALLTYTMQIAITKIRA